MSTQMQTAEGIIKVYDHITASLGTMLPKPNNDCEIFLKNGDK